MQYNYYYTEFYHHFNKLLSNAVTEKNAECEILFC